MISLIITVRNERQTLPYWLESIQKQTRQPNEIVIVDGGSGDGTWEWLEAIKQPHIRVFREPGNIAHGRNKAIELAKGEIIVVTDAGCIYHPNWFESLVEPIEKKDADFAATAFGPWLKEDDSLLACGIASVTIPRRVEFEKEWLASSRSVVFTKKLWESVGGYPEWIPYCEDVIFDLQIKKAGFKEVYLEKPLVFWRPRTTLRSFWMQLYNYTRSDGHGKLFYRRQAARFVVYGGLLVVLGLSFLNWQWLLVPVLLAPVYVFKFYQRWFSFTKQKSIFGKFVGLLFVPVLLFYGDLAKMWGWINGVRERRSGIITFKPW